MNSWYLQSDRYMMPLSFLVLLMFPIGCGAVGPPIPPEDVGIEAKVRKQQDENAKSNGTISEDLDPSVDEGAVELPTFYPIGTR